MDKKLIGVIREIRRIIRILIFGIVRWLVLLIFILIVSTFGIYFLSVTFGNKNLDTTFLTNIGFAILAVCAAVCFSWARALDAGQENLARNIVFNGERCFLAGIFFLAAS